MLRKISQLIFSIYPPLLLAMLLFPHLISIFLNYSIFDFREIFIILVWVPIVLIPYYLFQKQFLYKIVVIVCFIESFLGFFHWLILLSPITVTSLFVLSNTNFQESVEFLQLKHSILLIFLLPHICLFILSLKHVPKIQINKQFISVSIIVLCIVSVFVIENKINNRLIRKGIPQTSKAILSYSNQMKLYSASVIKQKNYIKAFRTTHKDIKQICILIIGESCNRNHMALYGYHRNTNPQLQRRNDIYSFTNVVTPYANTLYSVVSMVSESNIDNPKSIAESATLIDVFRAAGYKTYWLSNQSPIGVWDNAVTGIANTTDIQRFVNISSNSSFESTYTPSYDEKLFSPLYECLKNNDSNSLIIIHLMGSHAAYDKRYPTQYNVFNSSHSETKQHMIDIYDNSILYTDFIIDSMFTILQKYADVNPQTQCMAAYISDHGEHVYDEIDYVGHNFVDTISASICEIPFIFWFSDSYKKDNPNKLNIINESISTPYMIDDLFHSLIDLQFISTNSYKQERSLFQSNYNKNRIRILEDKTNYDVRIK